MERNLRVWSLLDWCILATLPLLLWSIGDLWMFFPVSAWFDPWFYLGISLNYDLLSSTYPETYFITRLPSIIPDLVAHKLFSPYWAVVATSFLKFYMCILPIYWTLIEITKNRFAAFTSVFILSFYPYFLVSISWHSVDGYGMGYIALTTALLTAACTRHNWKLWLFLAGISQTLMVFNYLFVIMFAVVQLFSFIILNKLSYKRDLVKSFMFLVSGGAFCTGLLGLFSYSENGSFWFFMPQIKAAIYLSGLTQLFSGKQSIWYTEFSLWIVGSTWLFIPGLVLISSLGYLAFYLKKENLIKILFVSQFFLMAFIYILFELAGFNFLQFSYFVSYLLPFSMFALGIILSEKKILEQYQTLFILCILVFSIICFSQTGTGAYIETPWDSKLLIASFGITRAPWDSKLLIASFGIIISGLLFFKFHKLIYNSLAFLIMLLLVQLVFNTVAFPPQRYTYKNHKDYELLVDVARVIRKEIPVKGHYRFWYDVKHDKLGSFFQPLAGTYLNSGGTIESFSNSFPMVNQDSLESEVKNTIILLSSDPDAVTKADQALREKGYRHKDLYKNHFDLEGQKFLMLAFLLESLD